MTTLTSSAFDWVCTTVRTDAAIMLEPGKEYLVESRLAPLAKSAGEHDVSAFIDRARTTSDRRMRDEIIDALTTNETSWFRDGGPFRAFETSILPELQKTRAAQRSVRVWSAACSTGQEPYSIAMILADTLGMEGWRNEIVATDLSPTVLRQAQAGTYSQIEMNRGLPASRLVKHFSRSGIGWTVNNELKSMISFRKMNLSVPFPPLGQFDVVFLRNVLIYFSVDTKREILAKVRKACKPDAFLILGGAETTLGIDDVHWERTPAERVSVYRPRS
jgi:chemotaxis protein methyltransferase CheR